MTTIRITRAYKSSISAVLSGALLFTSAGLPASRAYAQAVGSSAAGEAGAGVRPLTAFTSAVSAPAAASSLPSLSLAPALTAPSAALSSSRIPTAAAAAAPSAASVAAAAPAAPSALAAPADESGSARAAAAPAAASETPADKTASAGPRWVGSPDVAPAPAAPAPAKKSGPRWVKVGSLPAWVAAQIARWTGAGADVSRQTFDGDAERASSLPTDSVGAADSGRAIDYHALRERTRGARTSEEIRSIVDDMSIPTPKAAQLVGEIRRERGTPLWAKIVAPLSVVAAGIAALHFGAVGVLTLGAGLVASVLAHEVAHLAMLKALGDKTAVHAGEHSLNPFHHIDAVKTVILPALSLALSTALLPFPVLIGSGKAVDADFNNLRGPLGGPRSARNAFWVAAAGPLTNFALAGLAFGAAALLPAGGILAGVAIGLAHMNVALGLFNLLPLPQLDGGKMLASALPESWYAKWVYNPNVEKGYQGLFRRLYEGPTNLLTAIGDRLGVKSQAALNRAANVATFTALAAFYAVAYVHFSVALPLLFLALPCTYDYWCIREKVRSEAAVKDVMDIFSQWSAVIAQIAEDRGLKSEVSLFETEHAMKNALETLVDEMMAKEDFRKLPSDEKVAAIMAAYPEKAAQFLKDKVFTDPADTKEQILEMLADQRNTPFYQRLRRWFSEHDIFERWDNPKYEGKLRDQMKQAEKPKAVGQRGSTTLPMLGFLALVGGASMFVPALASHAPAMFAGLGLLGLLGVTGSGANDWRDKLRPRPGDVSFAIKVRFTAGTSLDAARATVRGYGESDLMESEPYVLRLNPDNLSDAADIARSLADNVLVASLSVPTSVFDRLHGTAVDQADGFAGDGADEAAAAAAAAQGNLPFDGAEAAPAAAADSSRPVRDWHAKLRVARVADLGRITVVFKAGTPVTVARRAVSDYARATGIGSGSRIVYRIDLDNLVAASEAARDLAKLASVDHVSVNVSVHRRLTGSAAANDDEESAPEGSSAAAPAPAPPAETAPATPAPDASPQPQAPAETPEEAAARREAEIEAEASAKDASGWAAKVSVAREGETAVMNNQLRFAVADAASVEVREKLSSLINQFDAVTRVSVQDDGSFLASTRFNTDDAAEAAKEIAQLKSVRSVTVPVDIRDRLLATKLPEKVASHGKEHWSTSAALVRFNADVPAEKISKLLGDRGQKTLFRHGDAYILNTASAEKAAEAARELAQNADVAGVEVHPNVAAALENRLAMPYKDAESYNPEQAVLIAFKPDTSAEAMKAYAEARHLRVVYPKFRGSESLSLLEVLRGADAAATRQLLIDETLEDGAIVAEVKPFREQDGAALAPSAAAVAKAEARKAALAAAEEAKRHKPRRDPQAEWMAYLQNHKLQDGTTLNPKAVEGLAGLLKPVARPPDDRRPPVVGRNEEVKRALPILTSPRGMRNSVMVIGEAGTGKTAVAEGLAEMIEDAEHASANDAETFRQFQRLKGRWLVSLDIPALLATEDPVGALTQILKILPLFNERDRSRGNEVILLMDEVQALFGDPQLGTKLGNVIKGPLRDGNVSVIATTTSKEYKTYIEKDDALRRRFEKIEIDEMNVDKTTRVLRAIKSWLEKLHDAVIPDEVLVAAAKLTDQFDKGNFNPDKAIKAVQDASERIRPENLRTTVELDIEETWKELIYAANEARQALVDKDIASTIALPMEMYNRVVELVKKAAGFYDEREAVENGRGTLTVDTVKKVIAQKTGIASGQLNLAEEDSSRYVKMEEEIGERVINQERTIRAIADAIRRNKAGLSNPNRPMGKFLMVGPTGVGKTYIAKELARFLFNDPEAMVRFDMSEFMEKHTAAKLIGSPPGYVGYGEGGQLTEAVRKKPYSVILFDEVEKAHPDVFNVLLQVLDDGRLTDGEGRTVDFKNTVILMTSNAGMAAVDGAEFIRRIREGKKAIDEAGGTPEAIAAAKAKLQQKIETEWDADIDAQVSEAILGQFRPEFLNRLDDGPTPESADGKPVDPSQKVKWIRVNRLREQDMRKIAELQMKEFKTLLADRHDTDLVVDPAVIDYLSIEGFSPLYGARPMTGAIEKHIINPLANWILEESASGNNTVRGGLIRVAMQDGKVVFAAEKKPVKDIPRSKIEGAAETMAAEVFSLIERLAGGDSGEEPSEELFDKLLRAARPSAPSAPAAAPAAAERALYAPGTALSLPAQAPAAALSDKAATNAAYAAVVGAAKDAGWPEDVVSALQTPAGQTGEGWLKQLGAFAKERARKAGAPAPELVGAVDADRVKALIHSDVPLTDDDRAFLEAHFTGAEPASFEAAQQFVDNMNLNSRIVRNHYLLDLYRRLKDIPGARMGYAEGSAARGGKGVDLWLEIRKAAPPAPAPAPAPKAAADPATPHEVREAASTRQPLMRFVDQSRLSSSDQDGTAIRVAAAEGYARLTTKADVAEARGWFAAHKWDQPNLTQTAIESQRALVMTAALIFSRFGGVEEIPLLENVAANYSDYNHYEVPLHNALVSSLAALYERAGLAEIRSAQVRAAQLKSKNDRDIKNALAQALGHLGYPADMDEIKASPEGIVALARRTGRTDEIVREFYDDEKWRKLDESHKIAALILVGADERTNKDTFEILGEILQSKGRRSAGRVDRYQAAQTWADLVARHRRTKGLAAAIVAYVDKHGIGGYNDPWGVLYGYVLAAEQAGGPEVLAALEKIMEKDPNGIGSNHEQMYFSTPEAWAKALIRSGKFAEYARKSIGPDGALQPSRLEKMLTSKERPMLVAAALRAIALSRDPYYKPAAAPAGPETEVPSLLGTSSASTPEPEWNGAMF